MCHKLPWCLNWKGFSMFHFQYMCRGQDAAISGDSTSSATPSASEMGDSPPHESAMSPSSYPNFLHTGPTSTFHSTAATSSPPQVGAASPSYSNGAMSPTHSPGAVSPTHSTGAVSPSHCTGGAVSPAHSSEASYPPYSSASISPTAAERLGGDPNEEDGKRKSCTISCFDLLSLFSFMVFVVA